MNEKTWVSPRNKLADVIEKANRSIPVNDASPSDVKKRKAERLAKLEADIKRYREYIAAAEAEIKEWRSV